MDFIIKLHYKHIFLNGALGVIGRTIRPCSLHSSQWVDIFFKKIHANRSNIDKVIQVSSFCGGHFGNFSWASPFWIIQNGHLIFLKSVITLPIINWFTRIFFLKISTLWELCNEHGLIVLPIKPNAQFKKICSTSDSFIKSIIFKISVPFFLRWILETCEKMHIVVTYPFLYYYWPQIDLKYNLDVNFILQGHLKVIGRSNVICPPVT